jgi:hypothetical protein
MLSESTSLIPLTELHLEAPSSPHYLRTRAITRALKGDYLLAIKDLTTALSLVKAFTEHQSPAEPKTKSKSAEISPDMECQCMFQRGGCYLALAIRYAGQLIKSFQKQSISAEVYRQAESEMRSLRSYARKAERDYLRFLSKIDYSGDVDRQDGVVIVPLSTLFTDPPCSSVVADKDKLLESGLTYHPLLSDALYSLLLAHTLMLTPPCPSQKPCLRESERVELSLWANTVARLQSICDGYPLFLTARSPYALRKMWANVVPARTGSNLFGSLARCYLPLQVGRQSLTRCRCRVQQGEEKSLYRVCGRRYLVGRLMVRHGQSTLS